MFAFWNLCHDYSLITSLSQQWLVCRRLNEVREGNNSSSDEVFLTATVTCRRMSVKILFQNCKHLTQWKLQDVSLDGSFLLRKDETSRKYTENMVLLTRNQLWTHWWTFSASHELHFDRSLGEQITCRDSNDVRLWFLFLFCIYLLWSEYYSNHISHIILEL